jgi:hypothetical protein
MKKTVLLKNMSRIRNCNFHLSGFNAAELRAKVRNKL